MHSNFVWKLKFLTYALHISSSFICFIFFSLSLSFYSKFVEEKNIFSFVRVLFVPFYSLGFSCFIFLKFWKWLYLLFRTTLSSKHSILKINLFLSQSCMVLRYYFPVIFFEFTQSYPEYSIKLNFIFQIQKENIIYYPQFEWIENK